MRVLKDIYKGVKKPKGICKKVFTDYSYRCLDCQKFPEAVFCEECIFAGNHEGHWVFREAGEGVCDCGDPYNFKESGFCPHHSAYKFSEEDNKLSKPQQTHFKKVIVSAFYILTQKIENSRLRSNSRKYYPFWFELLEQLKKICDQFPYLLKMIGEAFSLPMEEILKEGETSTSEDGPKIYFRHNFEQDRPFFRIHQTLVHLPKISILEEIFSINSFFDSELEASIGQFLFALMVDKDFEKRFCRSYSERYCLFLNVGLQGRHFWGPEASPELQVSLPQDDHLDNTANNIGEYKKNPTSLLLSPRRSAFWDLKDQIFGVEYFDELLAEEDLFLKVFEDLFTLLKFIFSKGTLLFYYNSSKYKFFIIFLCIIFLKTSTVKTFLKSPALVDCLCSFFSVVKDKKYLFSYSLFEETQEGEDFDNQLNIFHGLTTFNVEIEGLNGEFILEFARQLMRADYRQEDRANKLSGDEDLVPGPKSAKKRNILEVLRCCLKHLEKTVKTFNMDRGLQRLFTVLVVVYLYFIDPEPAQDQTQNNINQEAAQEDFYKPFQVGGSNAENEDPLLPSLSSPSPSSISSLLSLLCPPSLPPSSLYIIGESMLTGGQGLEGRYRQIHRGMWVGIVNQDTVGTNK